MSFAALASSLLVVSCLLMQSKCMRALRRIAVRAQ
jgi:hypothetical protein